MSIERKLQIGVIGSAQDLNYSSKLAELAEEVGYWIARAGAALLYGADPDGDSLPTAAARGAKKVGGLTVGFTFGTGMDIYAKDIADLTVNTGLDQIGRQIPLVKSSQVTLGIGGGSGTVGEYSTGYQYGIPLVALRGTGGWSDRMADQYFDARKRLLVEGADTPKESVEKAVSLGDKFLRQFGYRAYVDPNSGLSIVGIE